MAKNRDCLLCPEQTKTTLPALSGLGEWTEQAVPAFSASSQVGAEWFLTLLPGETYDS